MKTVNLDLGIERVEVGGGVWFFGDAPALLAPSRGIPRNVLPVHGLIPPIRRAINPDRSRNLGSRRAELLADNLSIHRSGRASR